MQRLLQNAETGGQDRSGGNQRDFDLVAMLEGLIASYTKHKETAKCLEASLKQLGAGFNTGYSDALTLLHASS